jgi:hypothetical protein
LMLENRSPGGSRLEVEATMIQRADAMARSFGA